MNNDALHVGGSHVGLGGRTGGAGVLVSRTGSAVLTALGKGPGMVGFAYFVATGLLLLRYKGVEVASLTGPLGLLTAGLFGGGAWKAAAEAKNGAGK